MKMTNKQIEEILKEIKLSFMMHMNGTEAHTMVYHGKYKNNDIHMYEITEIDTKKHYTDSERFKGTKTLFKCNDKEYECPFEMIRDIEK